MSRVDDLIEDFRQRTRLPEPEVKDAAWSYAWNCMSETLRRLDVILEDHQGEIITLGLREKIVRHMLYGAPSDAEAELRVEMMDGTRKILEEIGLPES